MSRKRPRSKARAKPDAGLPASFLTVVERFDRLLPVLRDAPDLIAEVETRRSKLAEVLAPVDAVEMLGQMVMSEMPWHADLYVESEHPGASHVIETIAAVLAGRADRVGSQRPGRVIDASTLGPARELTWEIALLEGLRRYRRSGGPSGEDPLAGAYGRMGMANLVLRNPGWTWQENEALTDLFEPLGDELREALGFDASEAVACSDAVVEMISMQVNQHLAGSHDHVDEALEWAGSALGGWQDQPPEPIRNRALAAIWALNSVGEAMLIRSAALADAAAVSADAAEAYLRALSTPFGQTGGLLEVTERIRRAPYIQVDENSFFLTVPGNDVWALRKILEQAVSVDRYTRRRGAWLEGRSLAMLADALSPDEAHAGVKIVDADGHTVLGEIDGLLRFGDTIIVVEAKAATMRAGARRGGKALLTHLEGTLKKAVEQIGLAREVLHGESDASLRTRDGQPLEFAERVREVQSVLVTMDDLLPVAPVVWELAGSVILPEGTTTPWVVTLHELDVVCQTVESPIQLIHFLRRRTRLNQRGDRIATEELDWWMLYLNRGLYFEDDEEPGPVRYLSQTDPLDAWVLYERGLRSTPAPKPRQRLDRTTEAILATLVQERPPGWVGAGCTLLTASGQSLKKLGRDLRGARRRAQQRKLIQRGTYGYESGPDSMLICWIVAPDSEAPHLGEILNKYVRERVDEFGLQRVLGLGLTVSSDRPYDALLTLEHAVWEPVA